MVKSLVRDSTRVNLAIESTTVDFTMISGDFTMISGDFQSPEPNGGRISYLNGIGVSPNTVHLESGE